MLSYHASGVPQAMHADPGLTIERRSGMRAATTFRKLPKARPGRNAMAATVTPNSEPPAVPKRDRVAQGEALQRVRGSLVEHEQHVERRERRNRIDRACRCPILEHTRAGLIRAG